MISRNSGKAGGNVASKRIRKKIKGTRHRLKIFKKIKIADFVTMGNCMCGFLAMLSFRGRWGEYIGEKELFFLPGIILIVFGMILDGVDGEVARWELKKFGVKNRIGHYLDSIADTITFCLAPAYLIYSVYAIPWDTASSGDIIINIVVIITSLIVALFGMLRLAKFVSSAHKLDMFIGLPTPPNAFIICVLCFLFHPNPSTEENYWTMKIIICSIAILLAFLMVSDYKYPKIYGKVRTIFSGLVFLFIISLTLKVFNIKVWKDLTNMEIFGLNLSAVLALGVALFYAIGSPVIMELKERKLVDLELDDD